MRWGVAVLLWAMGCSRIVEEPRSQVADADAVVEVEPVADSAAVLDMSALPETFATVDAHDGGKDVDDIPPDARDAPIEPELVMAIPTPRAIAVGGGYAFVTSLGTEPALYRVPLAGGTPLKIDGTTRPTYLSLDSTYVYWTDISKGAEPRSGAIRRAPILGGAFETLAKDLEQPNSCRLAFGNVYFGQGVVDDASILSVPATGGVTTTIASPGSWSTYVAVNSTTVCWARRISSAPAIQCAPRAGGTTMNLANDNALSLAIDDAYAFYATGSEIKRVALTGGTAETVAAAAGCAAEIAIDATTVYAVCSKSVVRVPKTGGTLTVMSTAVKDDLGWAGITLDATHVYWTSPSDNAVRRILR